MRGEEQSVLAIYTPPHQPANPPTHTVEEAVRGEELEEVDQLDRAHQGQSFAIRRDVAYDGEEAVTWSSK